VFALSARRKEEEKGFDNNDDDDDGEDFLICFCLSRFSSTCRGERLANLLNSRCGFDYDNCSGSSDKRDNIILSDTLRPRQCSPRRGGKIKFRQPLRAPIKSFKLLRVKVLAISCRRGPASRKSLKPPTKQQIRDASRAHLRWEARRGSSRSAPSMRTEKINGIFVVI
jgi:hypothetical protein